jgi:hypothetical protein
MATIDRTAGVPTGHNAYGVVEPNHLSAPRDGGVFAQYPAAADINVLENGMIVHLDVATGKLALGGSADPTFMVFNEEKLYDPARQMHCDFALVRSDFPDGELYPRLFKMTKGDVLTTNTVATGAYAAGDELVPGNNGLLGKTGVDGFTASEGNTLAFKVMKETTLPDGRPALKLIVTAE